MSVKYWDKRYKTRPELGSGKGSQGARGRWKADHVNRAAASVESVLDIGCGDARQAALYDVPGYLGWDPSAEAVRRARRLMPKLAFVTGPLPAPRDLHLSMDVIFHLLTEDEYAEHMTALFSAKRAVLICAPSKTGQTARHVRHWEWATDRPGWMVTSSDNWTEDGTVCRLYVRG